MSVSFLTLNRHPFIAERTVGHSESCIEFASKACCEQGTNDNSGAEDAVIVNYYGTLGHSNSISKSFDYWWLRYQPGQS
jgi:hypothetical protein